MEQRSDEGPQLKNVGGLRNVPRPSVPPLQDETEAIGPVVSGPPRADIGSQCTERLRVIGRLALLRSK
jgi:hypothetical protein